MFNEDMSPDELLAELKKFRRRLAPYEHQPMTEHRPATWGQALDDTEGAYRQALEIMNQGFAIFQMIFDGNGQAVDYNILEINSAYEKQTGLSREQIIGRRASKTPAVKKIWCERFGKVILSGQSIRFEDYNRSNRRWLDIYAYSLQRDNQLGVVFNDVTERKETDKALLQSKTRLQQFYESRLNGVISCTFDGLITNANEEFLKMSGYSREELRSGMINWIQMTPPEYLALDDHAIRLTEATGLQIPYEKEYITKDGSRLPILIVVIAVDQAQNEITAFVLDNSQRKQSERALQDAVEKYRLLFNSIDQGFGIIELIYDDEGKAVNFRYIETNPTMEQHFGLGNLQGKYFTELFPNENKEFVNNLAHVANTGEPKRYVHYSETLRRWYDVYAFRAGDQYNNTIAFLGMDITERRQLDEELRKRTQETEARLAEIENIYNSVPIGLCHLDEQLRYVRFNQHFAEMNGLLEEEHIGRTPSELVPNLGKNSAHAMKKIIESGEPLLNYEVCGITPAQTGVVRYWNENWLPMRDKQGKIAGMIITAEDISDRKHMQMELDKHMYELEEIVTERTAELYEINEKLRLSEERFRLALENSPTTVFNQDQDLRYTWIHNQHPAFTVEDVLGRTDEEIFPEDYVHLVEIKRRVMETGIGAREEVIKTIKGKITYNDLFVYPTFDSAGKVMGVTCVCTNITERKRMEEAMRQSEEKFAKAFHGIPIMMALTTLKEGRYIDANEAFCNWAGYTREEIIGRTNKELNLFVNLINMPDYIKVLIEKGKIEYLEDELYTRSGEIRSCFLWSQLIDIDGESCCITGIIDVTEQKHMELAISRLDRLNLIGEMAASIGHEIRNPMTTIRGFLQLLYKQDNYKKDQTYFELMIEELDRANDIVTEYLSLAKDKRVDLKLQHLDQIVNSLYPMIQADANYHGLSIKMELGAPPAPLIDEKEIRQLILNLARNGLEAMSAGGTLTIGTTVEGSDIILFVKDEGHGIDPDILPKLGTPFITNKSNGTGLGLAVCYSIAARHNARIDLDTDPSGTTFKIRFPMPGEGI